MGGALAHEAFRLFKIFEKAQNLPPFPPVYYVLSVFMLISGGLFSAAWEDNKAWKCFYLGVTVGVYIAVWSGIH